MKPIKLQLDQIGYDPKYYPRVNGHEDWQTVLRYSQALKAHPEKADPNKCETAFPPIHVVKTTFSVGKKSFPYLLLDGLHRDRAFHSAGLEEIFAIVERLPQSKWFARSVELNSDSKRGLDKGDRVFILKRLEAEGWKADDVAELLQMDVKSLERMRVDGVQRITPKQSEAIPFGRSNREINGRHFGFLKAPMVGISGTNKGLDALKAQGSVNASGVLPILDSMLAVIRAGVIDVTDEEIADKVRAIVDELSPLVALVASE